jgi:EmrB/QacA subfamily drug resistance transporter
VLSVTSLGNLLVFTNTTSVNVALPAISADLAVSAATADWFLLSFMVSMTMFVMVFGRISDILGRRRLYLGGLVVMTLASVAAALAQEPGMLIAMRLLQGVAAASIITNANAQVADAFPPRLLATGLSVNVMMASVASVLGPGLGGVLVSAWGWRSLFLVNVPFGMLGVLLGAKLLRSSHANDTARERFDIAGAAISAAGLAALLLGINRSSVWGWADPRVFLLIGSSLLAFVIFAMVERKVAHPLVDVSLIHDRSRGLAYCTALLMSLAQSGVVVMVALHEQLVRHASAAAAGLAAVPVALALAVFSPVGAQLSRLLSARSVSSLGAACATAGYAMLAWYFGGTTAHGPLVAALVLIGGGVGIFTSPNTASIMAEVPPSRRGIANGVRSALYNGGQALGTALTLLTIGHWLGRQHGAGYNTLPIDPAAVVPGFRVAATLLAVCSLAAVVSSLGRGGPWRIPMPPSAESSPSAPARGWPDNA